jgi:hypothetical protein
MAGPKTPERLQEGRERDVPRRQWGPYTSERQWEPDDDPPWRAEVR